MKPPPAHWPLGSLDVEFAAAFVDGKECQRVKCWTLPVTMAGYENQLTVEQLLPCLVEGVAGFPAALHHERPSQAQITVVEALELGQEVIQQLDGVCR